MTDTLLFFLPAILDAREIRPDGQLGEIQWYWSLVALALAVFLVCLAGRYGRNYFGRKAIEWLDRRHHARAADEQDLRHGQTGQRILLQQQVLLQTSRAGHASRIPARAPLDLSPANKAGLGREKLISVFIPTTPNPTSGFLVLVPESEIIKLDMSVADGIKFIISLGAIAPEHAGQQWRRSRAGRCHRQPARPGVAMNIERTTGLVLRLRPLTDTSLIVQWLTRESGRLAHRRQRGAPAPNRRFAARWICFIWRT